jgi:hypothetical protein
MPDLATILRAAPIGLLMLIGSYVAARRRKTGFQDARENYPALATRLGLTHQRPAEARRVGSMRGNFREHDAFIDPDERPRVVVYFRVAPKLALRSYDHEKRTPKGMKRVFTGATAVDAYWKDSYASSALATALRGDVAAFEHHLTLLRDIGGRALQSLSITEERLEATFDFGRPIHLPETVAERFLPVAADLVDWLEALAKAHPEEDPEPSDDFGL